MAAAITRDWLEAFPEPVFATDRRGRLLAANQPASELLQLPGGAAPEITLRELTGAPAGETDGLVRLCLGSTTPIPLRLILFPACRTNISRRGEGWRCELDGTAAALIRLFEECRASRFTELTRLVDELNCECMARRLSEQRLRSALAELRDLNSMRDQVMSQVSHELRTPLNAILGMTEFMRMQPFGALEPRYTEYVDDIHDSGQTLLALVDQVLHLTDSDTSGRERTVEALTDLGECLESCRRVVEPLAKNRELQIVIPADMALPRLRTDHLLVKQILTNLLDNAANCARQGGKIEVSVDWRKGEALVITVKDNGPGVATGELVAINGGCIARSVYATDDRHSGYGLVLSQRSAKALGGRLDIRSSPEGGTVAALVLPPDLIEFERAG